MKRTKKPSKVWMPALHTRAGILVRRTRKEAYLGKRPLKCKNPECQNRIMPGQTMIVWFRTRQVSQPIRDEVTFGEFCSIDCKDHREYLDLEYLNLDAVEDD